jgi:proteic killer suppression protein
VIQSFRDTGAEDLFNGKPSKAARKMVPSNLRKVARRRLDQLDSAAALGDLRIPPGNRLEALAGNRQGQHSIRINDQFRICFTWTTNGPRDVEVTDYH